MSKIASWLFVVAFFGFMSLGIKIGTVLPDRALLLVNVRTGTYVTVPCIIKGATSEKYVLNLDAVLKNQEDAIYASDVFFLKRSEIRENPKYTPDENCRNSDGFIYLRSWLFEVLDIGDERVDEAGNVLW